MSERENLLKAIATLEAQRSSLGEALIESTLAPLRARLTELEAQTTEKRRLVTVLFAGLSQVVKNTAYTALVQALAEDRAQRILDSLWAQLDETILQHAGVIDKNWGDGILAIWGLDQPQETDPAQAVRAALQIQNDIREFNQKQNLSISIRIGLNTGLVSVEQMPLSGEPKITSETVDVSAYLERVAPPSNILISQATYDQVRGLFTVEIQPPLITQERPEPFQTYRVKTEKDRAFHMPVRGLAGITTRTIGREAEIFQLQATYQSAAHKHALQWITILGEAGVGKSRLLTEFEQWLELRPERIRYFKGRAWPHTQKTPYFLLRSLLAYRFQISDTDDLEVARGKLTQGLVEVLGQSLAEEAAAFLGQLVGIDFHQSPWIANIAENTRQIRGRAEVLLREYFAGLCTIRSVVICLEDLHWADDESLEMLSDLLGEPRPWMLCVVGMARPSFRERRLRWGKATDGSPLAYHQRIELKPLSKQSTKDLVRELLQRVSFPPDWMIELLTERSGGNPYFMEELVHWLIEQGILLIEQEQWQVTIPEPVGLSVPGTIQGVLQARLEHLGPNLRSALQRAAVIGRVFWDEAVAYIGQEPAPKEIWDTLQKNDFIRANPTSQFPGAKEFIFRQVLLRDVVYEYTLVKLRRDYHHRAAEWLIRTAGNRVSEWAAVIANHYEAAEDLSQAAEWYKRAGQQAQATYAPDTAIQYYQKALNLISTGRDLASDTAYLRLEIFANLGEMLRWRARYDQAIQIFQSMLNTAQALQDRPNQAKAWLRLSQTQDSQGDYQAALRSAEQAELITQAITEANDSQEPGLAELAEAFFRKGWAYYRLGNGEAALELGQQALALSTRLDARYQMANSLNLLGGVYNLLGQYAESAPYNERSLQLYRELGDRERVASMLNNLGEHSRLSEDYRTAVNYYREALQMAQDTANRTSEMVFNNNLGGALVGLENYAEAEEHLRTTIQIAELTNQRGWISETYGFLAQACLGQGKLDQASNAALKSLALAQEVQAQEMIGVAWRVLGTILASGAPTVVIDNMAVNAVTCFANSLRIFEQTGMQGERARTLREWGEYEILQGDRQKGQAFWQEARQIFVDLGLVWRKDDHYAQGSTEQ
jgi:class 3 adenylate cyclase/tetratricopeptide (TPR) repeat protein